MADQKQYQVIYHTSDWHINPDREEEYIDVITKFAQDVEKDKREKIVVVAGDLFKNKIRLMDSEMDMIQKIYKIINSIGCPVIIIPGNHDYNINMNSGDDLDKSIAEGKIKYTN